MFISMAYVIILINNLSWEILDGRCFEFTTVQLPRICKLMHMWPAITLEMEVHMHGGGANDTSKCDFITHIIN